MTSSKSDNIGFNAMSKRTAPFNLFGSTVLPVGNTRIAIARVQLISSYATGTIRRVVIHLRRESISNW